tara:strand:+ start:301 stop:1287 length:987 start_codon:yes stop_codon:yes gene_type:complete
MSWFGILKQSVFAPADEEQARQAQMTQMRQQPPMFSPEGVQYYSTPMDTSQQMDDAQFFEEQRLRREGKLDPNEVKPPAPTGRFSDEGMETTYTAQSPSAKDRERARNLKFTSRESYRQHLQDNKGTMDAQAKTLRDLQEKVDNAETDIERKNAQLKLDQEKQKMFGTGAVNKPLRGNKAQVANTKMIQDLTNRINIKQGQLYNTPKPDGYDTMSDDAKKKSSYGKLTTELEALKEQLKQVQGSPFGQAQEYRRDVSAITDNPAAYAMTDAYQTPEQVRGLPFPIGGQEQTQMTSGNQYGDIVFDPFGMHTGFQDPNFKKSWKEIVRI